MKRLLVLLVALSLLSAACGDDSSTATTATTTTTTTTPPSTAPPTTTTTLPTTTAADDSPPEPVPAIDASGDEVVINWDAVGGTYIPGAGSADDPFFHIHSNTEPDGFFLGLELYTVYGAGWTGQTGTFPIDCGGTGICVHFSIGEGPDLGADFLAAGNLTINQLDEGGYNIDVSGLMFTDGTVVADLTLVG